MLEQLQACVFARCPAIRFEAKAATSSPEWLTALLKAVGDDFETCFRPCFERYKDLKPVLLDRGLDHDETEHHACLRRCAYLQEKDKPAKEMDAALQSCVDACFVSALNALERRAESIEKSLN